MSIRPFAITQSIGPRTNKIGSVSTARAKPIYLIGIISDTHNKLHPSIPKLFANVNEIWHLGDVCQEDILVQLRKITPKVSVVLGNNDFRLGDYPVALDLERYGERFHLVHIPPANKKEIPPSAKWLFHGHTHKPVNEVSGNLRIFSPGSAGLANKGAPLSVGLLYWTEGQGAKVKLEVLTHMDNPDQY
jgi:putative phosphoesterase